MCSSLEKKSWRIRNEVFRILSSDTNRKRWYVLDRVKDMADIGSSLLTCPKAAADEAEDYNPLHCLLLDTVWLPPATTKSVLVIR